MLTRELVLHRAKAINGWMSDAELLFLAEQASKSSLILEIGSYHGRSTRAMADNSSSNCKIHCVDPWNSIIYNTSGPPTFIDNFVFNIFLCNLGDHIKSKKVIYHVSKFADFQSNLKFDFIFIDGDHGYEAAKHDINKAIKMLKRGSILAGHDYSLTWPEVVKAVNEQFNQIDVVDTIWYTRIS